MKNIKNKNILIVLALLIILAITLKSKYSINNNYIKKYNNQEYDVNTAKKLLFLNFQEKYIAYYNYGTALYQTEKYDDAKKEFNKALKTVTKKRVCDVRTNLALTEIKLLKETDDKETYTKNIENIQNILLENSCATKDHNGRDKKSQDLYDLLEKAKEEQQDNQNEEKNDSNEDGNDSPSEEIENEESKIEQIKNANKESYKGRSPAKDREQINIGYKDAVW